MDATRTRPDYTGFLFELAKLRDLPLANDEYLRRLCELKDRYGVVS